MTAQYLRYEKYIENGDVIVMAYGRFDDGHKFAIRIPVTSKLLEDVASDVFESFVKQSVIDMKPEDIEESN